MATPSKSLPRVRTRFNVLQESRPANYVPGQSRTQQHQAPYADINLLVERFTRAGMSPKGNPPGDFLDLTSAGLSDLMSAENLLRDARDRFMSLDAGVRLTFGNNAVTMLEWLKDAKNAAQAVEMGLLPPSVLSKASEAPKAPEKPPEGGTP